VQARGTRIVAAAAAPCDSRRFACLFPPLAAAGFGPAKGLSDRPLETFGCTKKLF